MKTGQFGVVRTNGIIGLLIRVFTHSQVNHAYIYISETEVLEARMSGATISPASQYDNCTKAESALLLTPKMRARIVHNARKLVGTPYNFLDIAALFFLSLGLRWGVLLDRAQRANRLICSQLVDRVYGLSGVHLFNDGRLDGEVTPGDLLMLLAQGDLQ